MRLLRAFAVFVRRIGWKTPPDWTIADAKGLQAFLGSHTGQKFRVMLGNEIVAANERAAMSRGDSFECGWACGFRGAHAWFETLSAQQEDSPASTEDLGDLEQLAP